MYDLDVIVVGAGIGGLTAAVALQRTGHRVRVLDQVRQLRPIGAGISLWSNGVKVLDALGLGAEVAAVGGQMKRMGYRDQHGSALCDFSLEPLVERVGEHPYPVRRSDLQALLLKALGEGVVVTGRRCAGVEDRGDRVTVHIDGDRALDADLVVAADGTHSRLRAHVLGRQTERVYIGYHNWNGIVPDTAALGDPTSWMMHVGDGRRVSTMPVRDGQYFFFDVPLDDPELTERPPQDALREHFAGWDPLVHRLIDAIDQSGVAMSPSTPTSRSTVSPSVGSPCSATPPTPALPISARAGAWRWRTALSWPTICQRPTSECRTRWPATRPSGCPSGRDHPAGRRPSPPLPRL